MQHTVVRSPELEIGEQLVRVGHEIAIGKEQQFDQSDDILILGALGER
jgi:hypothetical protein